MFDGSVSSKEIQRFTTIRANYLKRIFRNACIPKTLCKFPCYGQRYGCRFQNYRISSGKRSCNSTNRNCQRKIPWWNNKNNPFGRNFYGIQLLKFCHCSRVVAAKIHCFGNFHITLDKCFSGNGRHATNQMSALFRQFFSGFMQNFVPLFHRRFSPAGSIFFGSSYNLFYLIEVRKAGLTYAHFIFLTVIKITEFLFGFNFHIANLHRNLIWFVGCRFFPGFSDIVSPFAVWCQIEIGVGFVFKTQGSETFFNSWKIKFAFVFQSVL